MLHDEHVTDNDIINLRNKGIIVAKSLLVDLSDYVDYDTADSFFNAVNKLAAAGQNVLNVMSPGVFSNSSAAPNLILDLSQYAETYYKYLSPSNLLPPFRCNVKPNSKIITVNICILLDVFGIFFFFVVLFSTIAQAKALLLIPSI